MNCLIGVAHCMLGLLSRICFYFPVVIHLAHLGDLFGLDGGEVFGDSSPNGMEESLRNRPIRHLPKTRIKRPPSLLGLGQRLGQVEAEQPAGPEDDTIKMAQRNPADGVFGDPLAVDNHVGDSERRQRERLCAIDDRAATNVAASVKDAVLGQYAGASESEGDP